MTLRKRIIPEPPPRPASLNGEHGEMWTFMLHMNSRIDKVLWGLITILLGQVAVLAALIGSTFS